MACREVGGIVGSGISGKRDGPGIMSAWGGGSAIWESGASTKVSRPSSSDSSESAWLCDMGSLVTRLRPRPVKWRFDLMWACCDCCCMDCLDLAGREERDRSRLGKVDGAAEDDEDLARYDGGSDWGAGGW